MGEFTGKDINIGGSAFWVLMVLISTMGLSYLMIWSFHNNSVKGAVISTVFITMIISGILLSRNKIFDMNSWGDNALSFSIGFFIWFILGVIFPKQSVLAVSVPKNFLFATIASELPVFTEMIINNFIIPISEELFWMIGIPFAVISIMLAFSKKWKILENPYLQIGVLVVVGSVTFALFHVGKLFVSFVISAIIFRSVMIVLVIGDYKLNLLKGINLVAGFAIGSHMAVNMVDTGVAKTWLILTTNIPIMAFILIIFAVIFLTAINRVLEFILGRDDNLIEGD